MTKNTIVGNTFFPYNLSRMGVLKRNTRILDEHQEAGKTPVRFGKRAKKLKDPKKKKKVRRLVILTLSVLVIGSLGYFGFRAYNSMKNVFSGGGGILNLLGGSQGQLLKGEMDGRVNVLLLGIGDEGHAGENLSDTMIVASYDTKSKAVSMISIPRDFYAKMPNGGYYAKLNAAHAYGEQAKEGSGPEAAKTAIQEISGLPIHYYVRVDFTGLTEIVDAVGGVTVDVDRDFCDYGYTKAAYYHPVCFKAGVQKMDGETALKYARSRKASGAEGSDFARSKRQQKIIVALKDKILSTETAFNPARVLKILESLGKHIRTDLGMNELSRVYELAKGVDTNAIINKNLDPTTGLVRASSGTAAGYILIPTQGQGVYGNIREFFQNVFAGVETKKEAANISYLNGTWNTYTYTALYDLLENDGFKVVADGGAKSRTYTTSEIIDYSGGQKPASVKYLEDKLGVKATSAAKPDGQKYDIQVILGKDYQ